MTSSEAFEVLGLPPDADAAAIKRAYHKLLKRHKPDRDPDGFRRIRDAFEVASDAEAMRAFEAKFEASPPEPEPEPESAAEDLPDPPRKPEVDPAVVHGALDRGELRWAYDLVMDDRWAAAMLDEHRGPLHWATRRVGLAVVMVHRPSYGALAGKYPDVFRWEDGQLVYLLRVSGEWSRLREHVPVPQALMDFASRAPTEEDPSTRRELARALGHWFWRDTGGALSLLDVIGERCIEVGPFLRELVSEHEHELDGAGAESAAPAADSLRALTWTTNVVAIVLALTVFFFGGFGDHGWGMLLRFAFTCGTAAGVVYAERTVYEALPSLRRRFLLACLTAGMEPSLAAFRLGGHPFLRRALASDTVLDLAFRIGRLSRLGDDA